VQCVQIDPTCDREWDTFVLRSGGTFAHAYHLGGWSEIHRRAYGSEPIYLAARDSKGKLAAGLPLVIEGGPLRGMAARLTPGQTWAAAGAQRRLSSLTRGGPIGVDAEARSTVLAAACRLVDEHRLKGLVLTTEVPRCDELVPELRVVQSVPTWLTPLPREPEELRRVWRRQSKNLSRNVTKAEQAGTVVRGARSPADLWRFYRQYVRTMRRHHATPRSWIEIRLAHKLLAPSGRCRVWLVEYQGEVIAGAMFLAASNTLELLYAGSDPRALSVRPNHAVYWHAIKWAIARGMTAVDWGPAPADGSLGRFKRQWSAEPVDVPRYAYTPGPAGQRVSDSRIDTAAATSTGQTPAPGGSSSAAPAAGVLSTVWDRIPVNALGLAATIGHRLL
jgi:Acetyltransferase (GNAT) domain